MEYLLPYKYHGYSGKKKGIIDTGRTIEFWCEQIKLDQSDLNKAIHAVVRKELCRRLIIKQNNKSGFCMETQHFVTLNIHPDLGKELGVFLHLTAGKIMSLGISPLDAPRSPEYGKEHLMQIYLDAVPHSHNINRLLSKSLHIIGKGQVHKVQVKESPCSIKVIFPYGPYRFSEKGKLSVDPTSTTKDRFDDLMLEE